MPEKFTDKDGNEVEMPTKEELEVQQQQAIEKATEVAKAEHETAIKSKEDEIAKMKDQVGNFDKLRTKTETQEAEEKELKERLEKVEGELKDKEGEAAKMISDHFLNSEVDRLASGDDKLKEQIKANLEILNMPTTTPEEMAAKVAKAKINAEIDMGQIPQVNPLDGGNISAAGGASVQPERPKEDKAKLLEEGAPLGISEEDLKKYGKI